MSHYKTGVLHWMVEEDQRGGRIAKSWRRFDAVVPPARILVTGLDTQLLPWLEEDYLRYRFGNRYSGLSFCPKMFRLAEAAWLNVWMPLMFA